MKIIRVIGFCFVALTATRLTADDFIDRIDDALTISAFRDNVRARLSGLIDLEFFRIDQPPPGLIETSQHFLFNPRLSLFFDAQLGPHLYVFAQSRVDRGFDPSDNGAQIRLDEYALRITPWGDSRVNLQIGKFATVVGDWIKRHLSWENPFITAPLPYENFTAISDTAVPMNPYYFLYPIVAGKYENNPLIWGPSYATGISIAGKFGEFDYAAEVKNSALASRPQSWDATQIGFDHPTFSGRVGFRPNESWNLGFSASNGPYFRPEASPMLPSGTGISDYRELLLGQDISFAWHHVQLWAEFYEVRFEVPNVGNADTFAYYVEGKYKFTPQLFGALRWNQQLFATVPEGYGGEAQWGHDLWRIDAALGYRLTAHMQLKLQYSFQDEHSSSRDSGHTFAAQFTVRF
jgi:hypothetical protein